jgi:deazaflavin-dependent oxidoreductase (nitroreductase family)
MLPAMAVDLPPGGTRGGSMPRLPGRLMQFFNDAIFRIFRNRRFMGLHLLVLGTVGARSGQPRRTTLGYFAQGDNAWIIIGSAGGAAQHPAWVHNLARHPDRAWIEVGNRRLKVRPETLRGEERARVWREIVAQAPTYASYPEKTDREIPLIRLTPA